MTYRDRYRLIYTLLLTALLADGSMKTMAQSSGTSTGVVVRGNVFGGGNAADVKINTEVNISTGQVEGNVYGGGNLGDVGTITKSPDYNFTWSANTGKCTVTISNGMIGHANGNADENHGQVFGAGKGEGTTFWCEKAIAYQAEVSVTGGTVKGNVYGGGQVGRVETNTEVTIGAASTGGTGAGTGEGTVGGEGTGGESTITRNPVISGSVYGAGAGLATHGYSALVRGDTKVTIQGYAQVAKSVYGGGETASVGRYGLNAQKMPNILVGGGKCELKVKDNAAIGEDVFGACKGVTPAYNNVQGNENRSKRMVTYDPDREVNPHVSGSENTFWNYYEDDHRFVWEYFTTPEAYSTYLETLALTTHPEVTIEGNATIGRSVFGGGELGLTKGSVIVNIQGGTVEEDVYGGGALADTNTTELVADNYPTTEPTLNGDGSIKTREVSPTTTVNLLGGTIKGDAYGGGLGQLGDNPVDAVVHGDINVNLGSSVEGSSATGFYITKYTGDHSDVIKSGRIFGCNNLLGSPQGNVTVRVWKTVKGNILRTPSDKKISNKTIITNHPDDYETTEGFVAPTYEVAAVYGGGNLADYTATGKKTNVIIETCDVSIRDVYGGGNAAKVPETDVLVKGAYEIQEVFGGGNGKDPYTTDNGTTWVDNPGADIDGNATTLLTGGYIHEAYGGSNEKGTITGNVTIDVGTGGLCDLDVEKMVGAGKNADVNGDLIMTLGCKPDTKIPVLYAGADNANVNGDVELTITSGRYGRVFGGNNMGGIIMGHIKLNIEETGDCETPIEIDELYLGGNQAMYSRYGYYKDGDTYKGRTAEMAAITDPTATGYQAALTDADYGTTIRKTTLPYAEPELNVISCTYIGQVFGGGFGTRAVMYANPKVNINMIPGSKASGVHTFMANDSRLTALQLPATDNPNNLGIIGTVYGGGNAADVIGNPTVNIGTVSTVDLVSTGATGNTVLGAYIAGNVYGGGKGEAKTTEGTAGEAFLCAKAMVSGDEGTQVNIGNGYVRGNVYGGGQVGRVEHNTEVTIGLADADIPSGGSSAPIIKGNVFGAGAGVNTHGYSALVRGHSTVTVQADSKVLGSVYGGGELASVGKYRVEKGLPVALDPDDIHPQSGYCYVYIRGNAEIGPDDMEMTKSGGPSDAGHVFGACQGVLPYDGYAADANPIHMNGTQKLVNGAWDGKSWEDDRKEYPAYNAASELDADYAKFIKSLALAIQTEVTISGNPFIKGSVYGGSENGYVQKDTHVTISGGQIGNGYVQMDDDGNYLATKYSVNRRYSDEEWAAGHLIKDGETNYAHSLPECASWPYGETITVPSGENTTTTKTIYAPYDKYAMITEGHEEEYEMAYDVAGNKSTNGGRRQGSDGHTFYGNVFGGGSGYYPYKPGRWFEDAGAVYGNTYVTINGGHILTSVYGGNEMTDVGKYADNDQLNLTSGGSCYVTMIGGTLGVPRTLKQIEKHPVTCYLFGAGKGDQRVFFNKSTNVGNVYVHISDDARIYGSVFGGGEDGHVMKNVEMNIGGNTLPAVYSSNSTDEVLKALNLTAQGTKPVETSEGTITHPYIGTWGTSYVDGNVFGGGRGFGGDAYTAGNVAGTVTMNIYGGTMLGSIYGGGRLGSVGYGLYDAGVEGYGEMREDHKMDNGDGDNGFFTKGRGHVDITISGGTIGNDLEYKIPDTTPTTGNVPSSLNNTDYKTWTPANWTTWKEHNNIPHTEFDTTTGRVSHTKGGNVFAGGMGRMYEQGSTTTAISSVDWWKLGNVKSTKLTISGDAIIKSCVYGGGELGMVQGGSHTSATSKPVSTEIIINGGTIGTEVKDGSNVVQYTFGSVFGGGYGSLTERLDHTGSTNPTYSTYKYTYPKYVAGRVKGSTEVKMTAGTVLASVYGGGEMAAVGESKVLSTSTDPKVLGETLTGENGAPVEANTYVIISGGTIGKAKEGTTYFGGPKMGNVYGGGSGDNNTVRSGHVYGNTNVTISGESTRIYHNVYGGGAYGTVGDFDYNTKEEQVTVNNQTVTVKKVSGIKELKTSGTGVATVTITNGTIGYDGKENGMVFGSSRGDINEPGKRDDHTAWVYDANVTIGTSASGDEDQEGYVAESGPTIKGSVYGSGENGHTFNNTVVTVNGGIVGISSGAEITYTENGISKTKEGSAYPYRGNVYGGGCGTDTYPTKEKYDSDEDGDIDNNDAERDIEAFNPLAGIVYGTTTVNINGGHVVRNVYGAGAMGSVGKTTWTTTTTGEGEEATTVTTATTAGGSTTVNINGGIIGISGTVGDGNVFGAARGAKDIIQTDYINDLSRVSVTNVNVSGGLVKGNVYGGGELGDVGTIIKNTSDYNYTWQKTGGGANTALNNGITENNTNTGICNVTIKGGTIGSTTEGTGNVFGGGKGDANTWWCEKAMAFATNVNVREASGSTTKVYGTVYGGGEIGRVEDDSKVIIGTENGEDTPEIVGSVFGAGKGLATRGYSALVRGNSVVTVQGSAQVGGNVFGGGEEASLGRFYLVGGLPKSPQSGGSSTVTIQDNASIGSSGTGNHVYGAGQGVAPNFDADNYKNFKSMQLYGNRPKDEKDLVGDYWDYYVDEDNLEDRRFVWVYYKTEPEYQAFLNTLAIASHPTVTIAENATVYGDVYGGGQRGITLGDVTVNITGGTVKQDVYGGGSLADTNKGNWDDDRYVAATVAAGASVAGLYTVMGNDTNGNPVYAPTSADATADGSTTYYRKGTWAEGKYTTTHETTYKTNVTLTGGEIDRNVYGGGLGQLAKEAVGTQPAVTAVEAKVYGDVMVKLNEPATTTGEGEGATTTPTYGDCEVKGTIFGCNNLNGSPQNDVKVHVWKTVTKSISISEGKEVVNAKPTKNTDTYELEAVYGGGNLAAYYPDDVDSRATAKANVIIDGCDLTSIKSVYGGGNAASVPATEVIVNGTWEIGEAFGGGNGYDDYKLDGKWYDNPGANVGLKNYTHLGTGTGTKADPILAVNNTDPDTSTPEKRSENYGYGTGKAYIEIYGGTVHKVYGGSNLRGNVREESRTKLEDRGCDFTVGEAYGGGNNAPQDGDAVLEVGCITGLNIAYGGASDADVNGNVELNITNGTYGRVFGGNNLGGAIRGSITVNIEETGCNPIIIGELYGGGNLACYSVYGYEIDGNGKLQPLTSLPLGGTKQPDPVVNVKSFTSIGNIFGGGFGTPAKMVGNPTVNVNVYEGRYYNTFGNKDNVINDNAKVVGTHVKYPADNDAGYATGYPVPSHAKGAIGAINNVFGGGNQAKVIGNPQVNIGTEAGDEVYVEMTVAVGDDVAGYYTRTGTAGSYTYSTNPLPAGSKAVAETTYCLKTTKRVDIRGNVFGGGNNAEVEGNTNVVVGKEL